MMNMICVLLASLSFVLSADLEPQVEKVDSKNGILDELVLMRQNYEMLERLEKNGIEVDKGGQIKSDILFKANKISDGKVADFNSLVEMTGGKNVSSTFEERMGGWLNFTNVILTVAVIITISSVFFLFGHYFLFLIRLVPDGAWHVILWLLCCALVVVSNKFENIKLGLALPGVFGMIGAFAMTYYLYMKEMTHSSVIKIMSIVLFILWGSSALYVQSEFIGFMSVAALMSYLGFMAGVVPGIVYIGFQDDKIIPKATLSAAVILAFHVLLIITGNAAKEIDVFRLGMSSLGSSVMFIGLLIMSSKWYHIKNKFSGTIRYTTPDWAKYWLIQIVTIVVCVLSLFLGNMYQINGLLGVAGTIFSLYLIEKYYEIPWKGVGWYWSLLGIGLILYGFSIFAKSYPQYFLFHI